ncbi:MAG TPA: class I tRNA ligase family protein [Thermoplasmata archaeon]|nr:class I tRNA ligase family protein [Thermoplasmata archaeon]
MVLELHDSLTGSTRPVRRRPGRPLGMYVCGPTVYAPAHVGHARTYLYFDVLRRTLEAAGVPVRHVMNLTDFEDKIVVRADSEGDSWRSLGRREGRGFLSDLRALGTLPPHRTPRSSENLPAILTVAEALARTGRVEQRDGAWYYDPPSDPPGKNFPVASDLLRHAVLDPGVPEPPTDEALREFVIWKRQDPPAPSWPSPFGRGVPGWHLECFAMARRFIGIPVDIHGGGADLVYPHHYAENEVALALRGTPVSRTFVHTGFVTSNGAKMSKSTGTLVGLRGALEEFGPDALRWYLLDAPYHQRVAWDPDAAARAREEFRAVRKTLLNSARPSSRGGVPVRELEALPRAIAQDLGRNLGVESAFDRLRAWTERLRGSASGTIVGASRGEIRQNYARIGALLGLRLT